MNKRCVGCGALLQSYDQSKPGYIPESVDSPRYCMRCFRIIHYNDRIPMNLGNIKDVVLDKVNGDSKAFKLFLVDLLNINSEIIDTFMKINGNKMLLISKFDIVPKSVKKSKIVEFLYDVYGIKDDIDFVSSKNNFNVRVIYNVLNETGFKKAYVLGYTNSGKSNLINALCNKMDLPGNITTSNTPNTTLDFIDIGVEGYEIFDTPGFVMSDTFYKENDYDLIDRINPKGVISPVTYQMKEDTRLVIENKIQISNCGKNSLTFYMSDLIDIKKYFKDVLNDKVKELRIPKNSDIVIKGLGFINVKEECRMKYVGDIDLIEIRKSMFGGYYDED